MKGRIDQLVAENGRFYSENQQLIEANELLATDSQHLQTVQEQLDLAMTRLNRHTDALETVIHEQGDRESTLHSLMGKLSGSRKAKEQQATQFDLTLGQQNKQIEKLRAAFARARSYEPSGCRQMGDESYHGELYSVRSDDVTKNSYTSVISFPAILIQDMSFCPLFRQFTAISDPD
jgi:septal ring factor EnvC (AmiA/AmiB activator)